MKKYVRLALSGGGTRGAAQLGAVEALMFRGIAIGEIIGTSAGALNAAMLGQGKSPMQVKSLMRSLLPSFVMRRKPIWEIVFGGGTGGIYSLKKLEQAIENHVPENYEDLPIPTRIVAYNWSQQRLSVFSSGDLRAHVRASMSLPVFDMPKIGEDYYEDGGVAANYPVDVVGWAREDLPLIGISFLPARHKKVRPATKTGRALSTVSNMIEAMDREREEDAEAIHIKINAGNHSSLDLDQDAEDIDDLFRRGWEAGMAANLSSIF